MRFEFVESVIRQLLDDNVLNRTDAIVAVCAGDEEKKFFSSLGFTNVTISNLDERVTGNEFAPFKWSFQDAQNLSFTKEQFDFAFVSDGLHHCASPHRALLEMYRVARKGIVMFEGRDSLLMRLANRIKLAPEYELEAVVANDYRFGGINNTQIPNYIYRWTERELEKTIIACNPVGRHRFRFFYGLSLPYETSSMKKSSLKLNIVRTVAPLMSVLSRVFPKQNNLFAMHVAKPRSAGDMWPWLAMHDGAVIFNRNYADTIFKSQLPKQSDAMQERLSNKVDSNNK
jgi:SAM-dependent methyltransferase